METRKVQWTGGSTYTVSLPKEWATEHDLEPGTTVHIYSHLDGALVVRTTPHEDGELAEVQIDVGEASGSALRHAVRAGYLTGYNSIDLVTDGTLSVTQRRRIEEAAKGMTGIEVVESTEDRVRLRSLLDAEDVSVRQSVVQLQFLALSTLEDAVTALLEGDAGLAERVEERVDETSRLTGIVHRHFQRALADRGEIDDLGLDRSALFDQYSTARELEEIVRSAGKVAVTVRQRDEAPDSHAEAIQAVADGADQLIDVATDAVIDGGDFEQAYGALERRDKLMDDVRSLRDEIAGEDTLLTIGLGELIDVIESGGMIAVWAINAATRETADE